MISIDSVSPYKHFVWVAILFAIFAFAPIPMTCAYERPMSGMISGMVSASAKYIDIIYCIICFIPINMMHCFFFRNWPSKNYFSRKDMLVDVSLAICPVMFWTHNLYIPMINSFPYFPVIMVLFGYLGLMSAYIFKGFPFYIASFCVISVRDGSYSAAATLTETFWNFNARYVSLLVSHGRILLGRILSWLEPGESDNSSLVRLVYSMLTVRNQQFLKEAQDA
jgi:hypothetical protein